MASEKTSCKSSEKRALFLLVATNLFYFSTYILGLYPLCVLANMATCAICLGGVRHLLVGGKSEAEGAEGDAEKYEFVKAEYIASLLQSVYVGVNAMCSESRSIVLWRNPAKSVYALVALYIIGMFVRILPLASLLFIAVWLFCGWTCFNEQYYAMVYPHVKPVYDKVTGMVLNVYSGIPRFKEAHKL